MSLIDPATLAAARTAGQAAKASDFECCCGHDAIDHAWGARRCTGLDSYGIRCTCPAQWCGCD